MYEVSDLRRRLPSTFTSTTSPPQGWRLWHSRPRSYDPAHCVPFGGTAARRISGALLDELRSSDWASRSGPPQGP
jgi:RNA polymerase sigma factor for flagellar operon FliA